MTLQDSSLSRNQQWAQRLLPWMLIIFLVPFYGRSMQWGYTQGWFPLKPRDFLILGLVVVVPLVMMTRPAFPIMSFLWLAIPVLRITDAAFLRRYENSQDGDHTTFVLAITSTMMFSLIGLLALGTPGWKKILVPLIVATIITGTGSIFYEWMGYAHYTKIDGRMSGWPVDPNDAPICFCLLLAVLFTIRPDFWKNMAIVGIAAPAIVLTLSRSGMAVFAALAMAYVVMNLRRHLLGILVVAGIAGPLAASSMMYLATSKSREGVVKNSNVGDRIQAIFELDFERIKSAERGKDLADGWEAVQHKPVFGWGTGAGNSRWQPHNMFVTIWLDLGIGGVLIFAGTLLLTTMRCVMKGGAGMYCLIPIWLYIPCSQTLMDTPQYLLAAGVCMAVQFDSRVRIHLRRPHSASPGPIAPIPPNSPIPPFTS